MSIIEYIFNRQIKVDFDKEYMLDFDFPDPGTNEKNAKVEIDLFPTDILNKLADDTRVKNGIIPGDLMGYCSSSRQSRGYRFTCELSDIEKYKVDPFILVEVHDSEAADDWNLFCIDLSSEEQKWLYQVLDGQFKTVGKSCEDLLAEARKQMEDL